jgi:hypothetical protein
MYYKKTRKWIDPVWMIAGCFAASVFPGSEGIIITQRKCSFLEED